MPIISPISESYLTSTEIVAYGKSLTELCATSNLEDGFLTRRCDQISSLVMQRSELAGRISRSEFTQLIRESDDKRDKLHSATLTDLENKAQLGDILPQQAAAAIEVLKVFEAHNVDINGRDAVESIELEELLDALLIDEMMPQLTSSGVLPIVMELKKEQENFTALYQKRIDADSQKLVGTIRAVAKKITLQISYIHSYLDASATDSPDTYLSLADKINELTMQTMTPARARRNRKEA